MTEQNPDELAAALAATTAAADAPADAPADLPTMPPESEEAIEAHVLAGLTEEERAALADEDDTGTEDDDTTPEGDDDATTQDEAEAAAAQAAAEAAAPIEPPAQAPAPAAQEPFEPLPDTTALNDQFQQAQAKLGALFEKYEDGELTRDEYLAQQREATVEVANVQAKLHQAEAAADRWSQSWVKEVRAFFKEAPDVFTEAHGQGFDATVRQINGDPAYANLGHRQRLELAHATYAARANALGNPVAALTKAKAADPVPTPDPKAQARAKAAEAGKPAIPPSLARVPAAAAMRAADGKFGALQAALDATDDPLVHERLMSQLSPEEMEAFASADLG